MKEKIINYIETLEAKSLQVDDYFKQRNDLYIENQNKDKEIERLNNIIKEVREYIDKVEILAMVDKVNIFSMSTLKMILDKENK